MIRENAPKIPIKNVFYMLCYAWDTLKIKDEIKLGAEEFDDAYNLLTKILIFGIKKIKRRGFYKSYIQQNDEVQTIKGKILYNETINKLSLTRQKCVCGFDNFSHNNDFNGIIKYTLVRLSKAKSLDNKLKKEIKQILLYFEDIDSVSPQKIRFIKNQFNRNNLYYRLVIIICELLYKNQIVNEEDGNNDFVDFFDEEKMCRLYEEFLLNFYIYHLDNKKYNVHSPKINWVLDDFGEEDFEEGMVVNELLPEMRTDIVIENKVALKQLIIDAKYYEKALVTRNYGSNAKFRREHISQVREYLINSDFEGDKRGMLIYPTVDYDINALEKLKSAYIYFRTVDLSKSWNEIEERLLNIISWVN